MPPTLITFPSNLPRTSPHRFPPTGKSLQPHSFSNAVSTVKSSSLPGHDSGQRSSACPCLLQYATHAWVPLATNADRCAPPRSWDPGPALSETPAWPPSGGFQPATLGRGPRESLHALDRVPRRDQRRAAPPLFCLLANTRSP